MKKIKKKERKCKGEINKRFQKLKRLKKKRERIDEIEEKGNRQKMDMK